MTLPRTPRNFRKSSRLTSFRAGRLGAIRGEVLPNLPQDVARWGRIDHMDQTDRQILAELQQDGRLTVTELAERVRISVSPCHRRVRALERSGVISRYR